MPSIVQGVAVTNLLSGFRFLIEWALNNPNESVSAYKIYRSTSSEGIFTELATVNSPNIQYVDTVPFSFGITYYYKVVAVAGGLMGSLTLAWPVCDVTFDSFEEKPFRVSSSALDYLVIGGTVTGNVNGTNATFTTGSLYRLGSTAVYINGLRKTRAVDYNENNNLQTITFTTAPLTGTIIRIDYIKL